ncbi:RHS repeat domain-containing protein [Paraburkholderia caribensis]|uniref:hypothetical protein n=1 Tax=Paraburkholderia caribensis TaxID=75105 RepID=UPI001D09335F|nr:hypothetical protein [Paraburkholderia caribensis]
MTILSVAGYSIGGLDGVTAVADAAAQLNKNPSDPKLIATYDAALANAAATFTAGIQGEGAAFAGNAIIANINNLALNQTTMSKTDIASAATAIAGELITLAGQGVTFLGLSEMKLNPILGGQTFTVGQIVNALGFLTTAVGAGIDSSTIASIVQQQFQSLGLTPDSSGNYSVSSMSSSNFICDASNASTMFDIVKGNNVGLDLPQIYVDSNNVATVVVGDSTSGRDVIVSPGLSGPGLQLVLEGSGNSVTLEQGSSIVMDATQANTIHNGVSGDTYTVANGFITGANGSKISAGSTDVFSVDSHGSQTVGTYNAAGHQTEQATFGAGGKLTQDLLYDATSGRLTQENDINADGSQVDHVFNANGTQTAYVFNAQGHETEQATFGTNGKMTQDVFFDSSTGRETQENDINADGSQIDHVFNADGTQTAYAYNTQGHETEQATFGTNGKMTQDLLYDATSGRLTQENDINADGSQVDRLYNSDGSQTAYAFNAQGHETERATFGANGKLTQDLLYDATSGRLTQENDINADGSQVEHIYKSDGSQTAYAFNAQGRETEQATFGSNGKITQDIVFDGASGRELQETDYDSSGGGVAHVFNPDGTQNAAVFDPSGHISEYATYGTNGVIVSDVLFDQNGKETQRTDYAAGGATIHVFNPDGSQTATVYNDLGRPVEFAEFNPSGQKTDDYFYDGSTGRELEYDHYGSDGSMVARLFNSDNSQSAIVFNGNGQEMEYDAYDPSGKLTGFTQFTYGVGGGYDAIAYGPTGYELGWADYGSGGQMVSFGGGEYDFTLGDEYDSGSDFDWGTSFNNSFGFTTDFGFSW